MSSAASFGDGAFCLVETHQTEATNPGVDRLQGTARGRALAVLHRVPASLIAVRGSWPRLARERQATAIRRGHPGAVACGQPCRSFPVLPVCTSSAKAGAAAAAAFILVSPRAARHLELFVGRPFIPIGLNVNALAAKRDTEASAPLPATQPRPTPEPRRQRNPRWATPQSKALPS